jgi:heme iron utilization protein
MNNPKKTDEANALTEAQAVYQGLLMSRQSAVLGTINADGSPLVSYAPFAVDDAKTFYIYTSTLAHHTGNLTRTEQASLMLIADEADTAQIFARQRLTFSCRAEELARDSQPWQEAAARYEARFAEMFKLIRGFGDFKMFRLTPWDGTLVVGFGGAYTVHGAALDHLTLRRR